jgi:DNA-binding transcriptional LysR family regulator
MGVSLGQLRALVAVVSAGTFTDAAIDLRVSQASVSRAIQGLEAVTGALLLTRTTRSVELTSEGRRVLDRARRILDEVAALEDATDQSRRELRIGYAWSALGRHTTALQREWAVVHPDRSLTLVQSNTPTAGLAEGDVDAAILRRPLSDRRFVSAVIGDERRYAATATDDPLAQRRSLHLDDLAGRVIAVDARTGTTTIDLWAGHAQPAAFRDTHHVDDWLNLVAAGQAVGITTEATRAQHPRTGVTFRLVRDAPPVTVSLAWRRDSPPDALEELLAATRQLLLS